MALVTYSHYEKVRRMMRAEIVLYALNLNVYTYLKNYLEYMSQFLNPLNFTTFLNSRFFDVGSVLFHEITVRRHFSTYGNKQSRRAAAQLSALKIMFLGVKRF